MPVVPVLGRTKWEDLELEVCLVYLRDPVFTTTKKDLYSMLSRPLSTVM